RDINLSSPDASILPPNVVSRQGFDQLQKAFGAGALDPVLVVVKAREPILTKDNVDRLYDFTQQLARDPRIARINGITSLDPPRRAGRPSAVLSPAPPPLPPRSAQVFAGSFPRPRPTLLQLGGGSPPLSDESRGIVAEARALARQYPDWQVQVDGGAAEVTDI